MGEKELGVDYKKREINLKSGTTHKETFYINIGDDQSKILETFTYILNFIGNSSVKPTLAMNGTFALGILSHKGWSKIEKVEIKWIFPIFSVDVKRAEEFPFFN